MRIAPRRTGFALVEIMVAVAIVALLASLAVAGFLRARKRSQAVTVLTELRLLDRAITLYAIENSKISGAKARFKDLKVYLKKNGNLYQTGKDVLGHSYGSAFYVGALPKVPKKRWPTP